MLRQRDRTVEKQLVCLDQVGLPFQGEDEDGGPVITMPVKDECLGVWLLTLKFDNLLRSDEQLSFSMVLDRGSLSDSILIFHLVCV